MEKRKIVSHEEGFKREDEHPLRIPRKEVLFFDRAFLEKNKQKQIPKTDPANLPAEVVSIKFKRHHKNQTVVNPGNAHLNEKQVKILS